MPVRPDDPGNYPVRPPTVLETYLGAVGIPDDVSFYVFRDAAVQSTGNGNWEANYIAWCQSIFPPGFGNSGVPVRVHNLAENNIWGYPPGPQCCQNLPPFPPGLLQAQIELLNKCADPEAVFIVGDKVKEKARQVWERVKSLIPPKV